MYKQVTRRPTRFLKQTTMARFMIYNSYMVHWRVECKLENKSIKVSLQMNFN